MKKEKLEALESSLDQFVTMSFMEAPLHEEIGTYISDDVMGFGTTIDEVITSLGGWRDLIIKQIEQAKEMKLNFTFTRKPLHRRISYKQDSALITEIVELKISNPDFENKLTTRMTVALECVEDDTWKVIHWHISVPSDSENDTWHVNELKEKTERLEKEVQERTAELKAKNYELTIEASVERVRSRAMGMQSSEDLAQVLETLHEEFQKLNLDGQFATGIMILRDQHTMDVLGIGYDANNEQKASSEPVEINRFSQFRNLIQGWRTSQDYFVQYLSPEDVLLHGKELREDEKNAAYADVWENAIHEGKFKELWKVAAGFNEGLLGGDFTQEPNEWVKKVLTKMASAFGMAYQRFKELQLKEEQAQAIIAEKERLSKALTELQATQAQLIQQEKLASLGQLTAGIAHEIKNPLNFVNNFSELTVELVDETKEELLGISENVSKDDREKISEALIILEDIKSNVSKIHVHGTRADSIVKAMLQHSRGSDGKMEPTDLNALVKEYVNLSFHGMRAGKNPIDVDIEFDLDDAIGEVPLIAEDFSRVIVNLTNNAFDACAEKLSALGVRPSAVSGRPSVEGEAKKDAYAPKVRITSKPTADGRWLIAITDNGSGIPDDIKDKILQPFFTTKKGTEGTGLGLSITNDIVKAHGGKLEVTSDVQGSSFTIILPTTAL